MSVFSPTSPTTRHFAATIYRVFPATDVQAIEHDILGTPTEVCVTARDAGDRAVALVLLEGSQASFVLAHGLRYSSDGTVQPYDRTRPNRAGELHLAFDAEWVELGPQPRVYISTHTAQEWVDAKEAMRHLLQMGRLSARSYIQSDHTGQDQGLSAHDLDATPHSASLVALFREAAYCVQNDLYEKEDYEDEEEWQDDEDDEDDEEWQDDEDDEDYGDEEFEEDGSEEAEERWVGEEDGELVAPVAKPHGRVPAWLNHALTYLSHGR
jgi:hypothetical protein